MLGWLVSTTGSKPTASNVGEQIGLIPIPLPKNPLYRPGRFASRASKPAGAQTGQNIYLLRTATDKIFAVLFVSKECYHKQIRAISISRYFFNSLRTLLTVFRTLPTFLKGYGWIFGMPLRCLEEGIQWSESISMSQNRRRDKTENMAAVITRLIAHRQKRVDRLKTHWGKDCGGLQSIWAVRSGE